MKIRRPHRFWPLRVALSVGRLERACWVVSLGLFAGLVAGPTAATAGGPASASQAAVSRTTTVVISVAPSLLAEQRCIHRVIGSRPPWPPNIGKQLERECFAPQLQRIAVVTPMPQSCARPYVFDLAPKPRIRDCLLG
ncbi:MAG: hypothetical protein E6I88_04240 [Chloroflexi bacterium]|nr:MAG: hypothetical protein E6I88_04240 [Chloroflexota bacterium]TME48525.1 MAG: hypothetical protein E6I56_01120 [Chloroflexota bacterium]